jgi:hypothetical protein
MTPIISAEWFEDLNGVTKNKIGKTLLLLDNATSQSVTKVISNVTVKFLPTNLAYEVQPSSGKIAISLANVMVHCHSHEN